MLSTTPPSTRNAAPVVAEDSGEAMYATRFATSSTFAARWMIEVGRALRTNTSASSRALRPDFCVASLSICSRPSVKVGVRHAGAQLELKGRRQEAGDGDGEAAGRGRAAAECARRRQRRRRHGGRERGGRQPVLHLQPGQPRHDGGVRERGGESGVRRRAVPGACAVLTARINSARKCGSTFRV